MRLHKYYNKNLWKPSVYKKNIFRIQSRFYFCHERLLKGKNIYYISDDEEDSDTGSSSLISHNDDILKRFKEQIDKYSHINNPSTMMTQKSLSRTYN